MDIGPIGILTLSNDLLRDILDYIEADPDRLIPIDRRAYLSVESFRPPSPPPPLRAQYIAKFRLLCRRFAELGAPYQFTRIATRFSVAGFERLERIALSPHLAQHTRKFSYLLPDFYRDGRDRIEQLFEVSGNELHNLDPAYFEQKAIAQKNIVQRGEDIRVLKQAMLAFRNLQHVQILRLQDDRDRCLTEFLHEHEDPNPFLQMVDLSWSTACTHAMTTIGKALSESQSSFSRFSGPMMQPEGAIALIGSVPSNVDFLAERLTCLELHFEDGQGLEARMLELSPLFKHVFMQARNLQALHIGFPSRHPLQIPLGTIFHDIKWERLRAFGVQSFRLYAEDIINLARRHHRTLRGLRLRDVLLLDGSLWRDVLQMLREEMEVLEWVSLRRIDYSQHFDELWEGTMEVPDYPASESDSDDQQSLHPYVDLEDIADVDWEEDDSEDQGDIDSDHGPEAEEIALSPDTPASLPFCTCSRSSYPSDAMDIGDNGRFVLHLQRKMWEKWVIGRCPEHGSS